ncbi:CAAX amino terminal protease self-immunity protein (plasmid) [Ligilactobacillus salivarius]|uniref:CAAX amino terminal protease self-immunity protein n=2 Tax=Ligilactobacillus salivarius TaxID=1624 RepID=A0A089RZD3_9LACO|nr:CAAX amino terminal protease self-immunity protein [Ligilactobacillus salivarius]
MNLDLKRPKNITIGSVVFKLISLISLYSIYLVVQVKSILWLISVESSIFLQLSMSICAIVVAFIIYYVVSRLCKSNISVKNITNNLGFKDIAYILLLLFTIISITYLANQLHQDASANQTIVNYYLHNSQIYTSVLVILVSPVVEESVFRKLIFNMFDITTNNLVNNMLSLIFSTASFCLIHVPNNLQSLIIYGCSGLILCLAYIFKKRLIHPVTLHMIVNIISLF